MYMAIFPYVRKWGPILRHLYRIVGAVITFGGGSISLYLAAYTGEQGGVAAFYFQIVVIIVYLVFLALLLAANRLAHKQE